MADSRRLIQMILSVIIPAFNEENTIRQVIEAVHEIPIEKEIIVINDGSTDRTLEILEQLREIFPIHLTHSPKNRGKGNAIRQGLTIAKGKFTIIQDADLEVVPTDIPALIQPLIDQKAEIVYGSRFLDGRKNASRLNYFANRFLAILVNALFGAKISDESTCYKALPTALLKSLDLECEEFEFCPEVTAKVLRRGFQIHEVPISYFPRHKKQGKKLRYWRDGWIAVWTLIKFRIKSETAN